MPITIRSKLPSNPLSLRRVEIEAEMEQLRDRANVLESELEEIGIAERVLARLSGASGATASAADKPKPKSASEAQAAGSPTMPVMIRTVLREAYRQGRKGLEPKEISDRIDAKGWGPINRDVIRTRTWRLARDGKLTKDGSFYSLVDPENEKPADDNSEGNESAGLFSNQGREAGLGR